MMDDSPNPPVSDETVLDRLTGMVTVPKERVDEAERDRPRRPPDQGGRRRTRPTA